MNLTNFDAQVLDLAADDYYGLWEICDFVSGLMPNMRKIASTAKCKTIVARYLKEGLVEVFVGRMERNEFRLVEAAEAEHLLSLESSWQRPDELADLVAISTTPRGEQAAASAWHVPTNLG